MIRGIRAGTAFLVLAAVGVLGGCESASYGVGMSYGTGYYGGYYPHYYPGYPGYWYDNGRPIVVVPPDQKPGRPERPTTLPAPAPDRPTTLPATRPPASARPAPMPSARPAPRPTPAPRPMPRRR